MIIKCKLQIYLILLSSFLLLMSFIVDNLSLGDFWFFINSNSLVGFQSFSEEVFKSYKFGFYLHEILIQLLNTNLFIFFGILTILISLIIFLLLGS